MDIGKELGRFQVYIEIFNDFVIIIVLLNVG